jgi:hypothetical protein
MIPVFASFRKLWHDRNLPPIDDYSTFPSGTIPSQLKFIPSSCLQLDGSGQAYTFANAQVEEIVKPILIIERYGEVIG